MSALSVPMSSAEPLSCTVRLESESARAARRRRLYLAMIALVLMGMADLYCTLAYMTMSGMIEVNPVARAMITIGEGPQLILFKVFTMALSCGALFLARENRKSETAAWLCTVVMLVLTLHWANYNRRAPNFTNELTTLAMSHGEHEPRWVKLD
jgi:hypothetical protein